MPVAALPPDPRNPKGHALDEIEQSMERFGYVEPVVIDERTGQLLSGHGRREVLLRRRERGDAPPVGVEIDEAGEWTVQVVRGVRTPNDAEAGAYLVAANRLTERGGWLADPLAAILEELRAGPGFEGTGYTSHDLDTLLGSLKGPDAPDEFPDVDPDGLVTEHECPRCGFEF
jgi:hypothetical protein